MGAVDPRQFVLGLDLGQSHDYSALVIVEATGEAEAPHLICKHIERPPLGTSYPAIVELVGRRLATLRDMGATVRLALDKTGVGAAVADLFLTADLGVEVTPVTITGGDTESRDGASYRVPKRDLVGCVSVLLQQGRLQIVKSLPLASILVDELKGFKAAITASGHDRYGNDAGGLDWRSAPHDDCVLALALACWLAIQPVPVLWALVDGDTRPAGESPFTLGVWDRLPW